MAEKPSLRDQLFPVIYGELRNVAKRYLGREKYAKTFQPTALVNEAWLKLRNEHGTEWQGRTHGLALGALAMRQILVDHARRHKAQKRGERPTQISFADLAETLSTGTAPIEHLIAVEQAISRLEDTDPRMAQVVSLRFFSGMSVAEVADYMNLSTRTVEAEWTHARAILKRDLSRLPDTEREDTETGS
jgi:RNA polymerase sigma-70 factor, ECF subfamily